MTYKEKIEAELERLKYAFNQDADIASTEDAVGEKIAQAKYELCCALLDFSNSLPEAPVSEELEKEMDNYLASVFNEKMDGGKPRFTTWFMALRKTAIHFTNWQKEQMMKDAVEAKVYNKVYPTEFEIETNTFMQKLKHGDNVKLIIIKEE